MSLILTPDEPSILLREIRVENMRDVAANATATGWKVSLKRGMIAGVGVSVSGVGAWVKLSGHMTFRIRTMKRSRKLQQLTNAYNISVGISGFFSWLGFGVNASVHREEITSALQEVMNTQTVQGSIDPEMMVTGLFPNVQVEAAAYVLALQITDNQGNTTNVVSTGDAVGDTGAQDTNGGKLPTTDNQSTINF
jgi:hypothetical protein